MTCTKSYTTLRGTKCEHWLRSPTTNCNIIGTKWVFCNKQDEDGQVVHNKARLVAQGYTQVEGMDYGETCVPAARLLSPYASYLRLPINMISVYTKWTLKVLF